MSTPVLSADKYERARQAMVRIIKQDVRETSLYLDKEVLDPRVMTAIANVPRHQYVPGKTSKNANERPNTYIYFPI